ncbi:3'(2'),5'-bisphosphate nucleotidase CysQ [Pseudorhodoplanes sp.]|uniref:3'(2'),5'-bisphosphate nucleotidase CysQ n=1 Tax=Pseudorhodoplanes sp. TaxID=1934341 RepID=UPI002BDA25ED|nr:3'(2'),5'-bisphosphate nucleotidase CysQ [Pseudorhodoplanes sp.]HWV52689.1 3'(2'),5'-bisphosphate nucleotidase CysQ [Pseudorhodoplanes sp.]
MTNEFADPALLDALTGIASQAGAAIMRIRSAGTSVRTKSDASPVTEADEAAEAIILDGLTRTLPGITVVSEEAASREVMPALPDIFVLVDPLDGTREFIDGRDEFTVNIAIVRDGRPLAGIVAAPALGTIWRGAIDSGSERLRLQPGASPKDACERSALRTHAHQSGPWRAVVSRSHLDPNTEQWLTRFDVLERLDCGSSVKFCRIAEGTADVYPRLGRTSEWDIAAGDAVLTAAGGVVLSLDGTPVRYGQIANNLKVPSFVAWCDPADAARFG